MITNKKKKYVQRYVKGYIFLEKSYSSPGYTNYYYLNHVWEKYQVYLPKKMIKGKTEARNYMHISKLIIYEKKQLNWMNVRKVLNHEWIGKNKL